MYVVPCLGCESLLSRPVLRTTWHRTLSSDFPACTCELAPLPGYPPRGRWHRSQSRCPACNRCTRPGSSRAAILSPCFYRHTEKKLHIHTLKKLHILSHSLTKKIIHTLKKLHIPADWKKNTHTTRPRSIWCIVHVYFTKGHAKVKHTYLWYMKRYTCPAYMTIRSIRGCFFIIAAKFFK